MLGKRKHRNQSWVGPRKLKDFYLMLLRSFANRRLQDAAHLVLGSPAAMKVPKWHTARGCLKSPAVNRSK